MNSEDEEFNRIENEADMRRKAVRAALNDHLMHMRANLSEYERGVIDGRQLQVQSSVDKAVNALSKRQWIGLTDEEIEKLITDAGFSRSDLLMMGACIDQIARLVEATLKERNT
jgi:hypothetical protein